MWFQRSKKYLSPIWSCLQMSFRLQIHFFDFASLLYCTIAYYDGGHWYLAAIKKHLDQTWSCVQIFICLQIWYFDFFLSSIFLSQFFPQFLLGILLLTIFLNLFSFFNPFLASPTSRHREMTSPFRSISRGCQNFVVREPDQLSSSKFWNLPSYRPKNMML